MIDLHCHTIFSDGILLPAEMIQTAEAMGHQGLALTDHADQSNLDFVLPKLIYAVRELNKAHRLQTLAGVELTHVPPVQIESMVKRARQLGAQLVIVHGQTIGEPVAPGTNRAAIMAGADIVAHPGLLTLEDAQLAAQKGVFLEISARNGHCLGNGRVAAMARAAGAALVFNTDSHRPGDLLTKAAAANIAMGAGLNAQEIEGMFANSLKLWKGRLLRDQTSSLLS
jgi:histidinol phosphatase-like PHP family hydrolase